MLEQQRHGLPALLPEPHELREESFWRSARDELMRSNGDFTPPAEEYLDFLRGTVEGFGYKIIDKKELKKLRKCCAAVVRVPVKVIKPEKKKVVLKEPPKRIEKVVPKPKKKRVMPPVERPGVIVIEDSVWGIKPKK